MRKVEIVFFCVRAGNNLALMCGSHLTLCWCMGLELHIFSVTIDYQQGLQEGRGNESRELHGRTGAQLSLCAPPQRRRSRASIEMGGMYYLRHPGVVPSHRGGVIGDPGGHPPEGGRECHSSYAVASTRKAVHARRGKRTVGVVPIH